MRLISRPRRRGPAGTGLPDDSARSLAIRFTIGGMLLLGIATLLPAGAGAAEVPDRLLSLAPLDSLPLPPGEVTGLTWRGLDTLAVLVVVPDSLSSAGREQVFLSFLDRAGELLHQADFTGSLRRGLTYDGAFYWACGDDAEGGSLIYKIDPDTLIVREVFSTPGHHPMALCWDGGQIWISDRDSGRLDRFDIETGRVTRSALAPGFSPAGLAWDGRFTWVTDSATGRLYRLGGARRRWNATVDTTSFLHRGEDVLLLHDGTWLWYHVPGTDHAVRARFE